MELRFGKKYRATIIQYGGKDAEGKVRSIQHDAVRSFAVSAGFLVGNDSKGKAVMMVPVAEVALATIDEVKND